MKAKSLTLVMLLCFCRICPVSAQIQETFWHWQVIDTAQIVCTYEYTDYMFIRSRHFKAHETFLLAIGNHLSKYYSYDDFQSDSLFYTTPQAKEEYQRRVRAGLKAKGKTKDESLAMMMAIMPKGEDTKIYKHYPKDSLTVQDWVASRRIFYTEAMEPQAWEILPDTSVILGYPCQRAECDWRGRHYTAWFTEEIPISDGPYKFHGLPGLILAVRDSTDEYCWELRGIEMPEKQRIYHSEPPNGDRYERTDRIDLLKKMWKQQLALIKKVNADAVMLGKEPPVTEDPYDLIELDYK